MNELTVLLVAYLLPLFTDFMLDYYIRFKVGWFLIALVTANFAINVLKILLEDLQIILKLLKMIRLRFRLRKIFKYKFQKALSSPALEAHSLKKPKVQIH